MAWNWQREDWPHFTYDHAALEPLERTFLKQAGMLLGAYLHVSPADQDQLKIELMSNEALKTLRARGSRKNLPKRPRHCSQCLVRKACHH